MRPTITVVLCLPRCGVIKVREVFSKPYLLNVVSIVIVHPRGNKGFISTALLIFKSGITTGDYLSHLGRYTADQTVPKLTVLSSYLCQMPLILLALLLMALNKRIKNLHHFQSKLQLEFFFRLVINVNRQFRLLLLTELSLFGILVWNLN